MDIITFLAIVGVASIMSLLAGLAMGWVINRESRRRDRKTINNLSNALKNIKG